MIALGIVWGFFIHANLRWRLGPLEWLVATPAFHHWHHSRNDHINRNYASTLPLLDPAAAWYVGDVLGSAFAPALVQLFAGHEEAVFDYISFRRDMEGLAAERAAPLFGAHPKNLLKIA